MGFLLVARDGLEGAVTDGIPAAHIASVVTLTLNSGKSRAGNHYSAKQSYDGFHFLLS